MMNNITEFISTNYGVKTLYKLAIGSFSTPPTYGYTILHS